VAKQLPVINDTAQKCHKGKQKMSYRQTILPYDMLLYHIIS